MSLEHWYRLLGYLTLGLSCAALVLAEAPFLPDLQFCLAPVLALLLLGWWFEGRWSLPNRGADLLGLLIVIAGTIWVLTHQQRTDEDFVLAQLPLQVAMLPYMGPLLMAALLVKVFRRHDPNHFWHVQGMALTQIALGCMLDGGPAFGAAMAVYLACAVACLALHYRLSTCNVKSQEWGVRSEENKNIRHSSLAGWWLLSFTPRWTLSIAVPALLLFLLTPRHDDWAWEPLNSFRSGSNRIHVQGGSGDMNLNNTGRLELDNEVALQVEAVDAAGRPKLDLPIDQRWRSTVLDWYQHGTWTMLDPLPTNLPPIQQSELPDFGPDRFYLTFTVQPRRAGGLVLAEPIAFGRSDTRLPVLALGDQEGQRLFVELASTLLPLEFSDKRREYHYQQVVPVLRDPTRIRAIAPHNIGDITHLVHLPPEIETTLQSWTVALLRRLANDPRYQLPGGVRATLASKSNALRINYLDHEATGRLLADYLAHSGDYTYPLNITRRDRSLDPIVDFLINVKKGHCERYAAALASMLRSMGIPARIVKGFRGWSSKGNGIYEVRHHHAHAWVEILVVRSRRPGPWFLQRNQGPSFDWVTLDPTPAESTADTNNSSQIDLWDEVKQLSRQGWRSLIIDYNSDDQADLLDTVTTGRLRPILLRLGLAALSIGAAVGAWLLFRRLRHRRLTTAIHGNGPDAAFYPRLVRILARYVSLRPQLGQTPREYGEAARDVLHARPAFAALADWPIRVVHFFYRSRYGGRPLREEERRTLDSEFERFAEALRHPQA